MESVNLPPLKSLHTKVVELGTGRTENVLPVQTTGSSTIMEFVSLFLTNARPLIVQEPVFLATLDTTLKMELVFLPQLKLHLMLDVVSGTGTRENALSAQTTGSSTTECVSLSQISAEIMTLQELVFHVMKDTTLSWEDVRLHLLKNLQMKDVELGTGKTKDVWNVQITGSSMDSENVFLFLINAKPSIDLEIVSHVMRVTTSSWEDASLLLLRNLKMKVAEPGTGKTENALLAQTTGFSTDLENVSPFQTNARLSTPQELVSLVMKDTTFKMELVSSPQLKSHLMLDVEFGTGKTENVLNAPTTGSSITLDTVFQFQTNAKLSTPRTVSA